MAHFGNTVEKTAKCPKCQAECKRHSQHSRKVVDVNGLVDFKYGKYTCKSCKFTFVPDCEFVEPGYKYSKALVTYGLVLLTKNTYENTRDIIHKNLGFWVPKTSLCDWKSRWTKCPKPYLREELCGNIV